MGWNWSPSRNFFSHCFYEFQRDGEIGRDFSRTSGWNFEVQENKKKYHPREIKNQKFAWPLTEKIPKKFDQSKRI